MRVPGSSVKSFTKVKGSIPQLQANRNLLGKSLKICTIDAECCAKVVVYVWWRDICRTEYIVVWYGCVVWVVLVKSGAYSTIP